MLPAYVAGFPHGGQYTDWNAPIQAAFACLQGLTSLDLSCNNLTSSNINTLLLPPPSTPVQPGSSDTALNHSSSLTNRFGFKTRLQSLNISGSTLTPPSPLVDTLKALTALTCLNVADTALRTADFQELAPALVCMTAMRWLSIGGNRITQRAAGPLSRALACMPQLERLDASGHIMFQFGPSGLIPLSTLLLSVLSSLSLS